jgi:hypothetical protein
LRRGLRPRSAPGAEIAAVVVGTPSSHDRGAALEFAALYTEAMSPAIAKAAIIVVHGAECILTGV